MDSRTRPVRLSSLSMVIASRFLMLGMVDQFESVTVPTSERPPSRKLGA